MTDETPCTYCGHPRGTHAHGGRCWNDVRRFDHGWRMCTCPTFRAPETA